MKYPLISEYIESIKSSEDNFDELSYLKPVLGVNGEPIMSVGGFSVIFKMKDEQKGKFHAVKCFTKEQKGRADSYKLITDELEFVSSNYLTPIKYYENELFVDTDQTDETEFPVLLMDWVDGKSLDLFIKENINYQYVLELLSFQFDKLAAWLITQPFAHGDLKPDNILVCKDGTLVLVDYDGMYVPAMKGQNARENGSPGFRHPLRTEDTFDEHIDDFSIASIALSLKAIALKPSLYEEYSGNDYLLFCERDFYDLSSSKTISSLQQLMTNKDFCTLFGIFMITWALNDISVVSYKLFNLQKVQEDIQKSVALYLKARDYINDGKNEKALDIFITLAQMKEAKSKSIVGLQDVCGKTLGENGIGYMYAKGLFVEQDFQKAVFWFKKAAKRGFPIAIFNLSIAFRNGEGVEQNVKEEQRLNHQAATKGFLRAISKESVGGDFGFDPKLDKMYLEMHIKKVKELSVYTL